MRWRTPVSRRTNPSEYEAQAEKHLDRSSNALAFGETDKAHIYAVMAQTYATLALFAVQRLGSPAYYEQDA